MLPSSKFSRLALAVACLLVGSQVLVIEVAGPRARGLVLSDLLQSAIALWAGICAFRVSQRSTGYLRRLWWLITVSVFLASSAQILKTYYKHIVQLPFASPWPSDILFMLWAIPALMMLLPRSDEESGSTDWPTILDFVQLGIVALTAYLYFFHLTSRWQAEGSQMVLNVFRVQLYRDIAIAAAFLLGSRASALRPGRKLFQGVTLFFLLEAGWAIFYLVRWPTAPGQPPWDDVVWTAPYFFLIAFAGNWKTEETVSPQEQPAPRKATLFSRVLPACIPLVVLWMSLRIAHEQTTLAWAAISASFVVSTTRLILTNEKQRRIAESLREAEIALQQSAEMFTTAFRSSLDAISISLLPEGRFLIVNESFSRMTGYTQEEVSGKTAADLNMWVDLEQRSRIFAKLQIEEEIREEEFLMRAKGGDIRTVQISAAKVQVGGRPGILGMVRDVTDRRRAEEALRVSEERFRTLVQDLHVGIVLLGPKAETLFANRAVLETFGVRKDEVLGKSTAQFEATLIREDGREMPFAERPAPRAILTKRPVQGEVVGWLREGYDEVLWTLVDAVPHLNQQGEVANVILSISDITARKRAEEAQEESEERFRTLVESLHIGVVLLGSRAEILFANAAALEIFGLSAEQVLGRTSEEIDLIALNEDGVEIPFANRPAPRALTTGQPVRNQVMGWRRPGSEEILWVLGEVVPLSKKEGKPDKLVCAFSNITKRKEAEEALHQLSARLLRLQDEERRRLGRELHESLAQSVMAVNLDLAQVARSSLPLEKKARQALAEAREILRGMSREIRTLAYLLHPPVLDELGLASAVKEYAQGFSDRSGISLEIEIQKDFPRMPQATETAFFRIVQESLANIQRHSGSSTGSIRLRCEQGCVQLQISDEGRGMTSRPQGNGPEARKASRLGVGIHGMRKRMLQLGGALEVQSSPSGTTVRATISLAPEEPYAAPSHSRSG